MSEIDKVALFQKHEKKWKLIKPLKDKTLE